MSLRRFNDLIGLGYEGYPALLALSLLAWHERRGLRRSAPSILYDVLPGSDWFREKAVRGVVSGLDARGYVEFECQSPMWRSGGWRRCPKAWKLTVRGYERLQQLLSNLGLAVEDVLGQPSPLDVKSLIDSRIKNIYKEHWERVKQYMEAAAGEGGV